MKLNERNLINFDFNDHSQKLNRIYEFPFLSFSHRLDCHWVSWSRVKRWRKSHGNMTDTSQVDDEGWVSWALIWHLATNERGIQWVRKKGEKLKMWRKNQFISFFLSELTLFLRGKLNSNNPLLILCSVRLHNLSIWYTSHTSYRTKMWTTNHSQCTLFVSLGRQSTSIKFGQCRECTANWDCSCASNSILRFI